MTIVLNGMPFLEHHLPVFEEVGRLLHVRDHVRDHVTHEPLANGSDPSVSETAGTTCTCFRDAAHCSILHCDAVVAFTGYHSVVAVTYWLA
jgi:hypothetical protein